jgi:hypothetical protein
MSDTTTMPFQPRTVDDAPGAPELDDSPGNKPVLLIVGALAGLAVLAIAAYFLLFAGGDDKPVDAAAPTPSSVAQPSAAPSTAPDTTKQPKISKRNFGTDPFKPLIVDTTTGTTVGTTTGTTTDPGTAPTVTAPTGTTAPTTAPTTTPTASQSYRFRVVKVATGNKTIDVKVDGKAYIGLKAGEVFADVFKVRGIGGNENVFQIGDLVFSISGTKAVTISS